MAVDPAGVRDAAAAYVEQYGTDGAIERLQTRFKQASSEQEQNAVLEALAHVRRRFEADGSRFPQNPERGSE